MAARLKVSLFKPPGGKWFYRIPETGLYVESERSLADLVDKAAKTYQVNKQEPPGNLQELVEAYMCERLPESACLGSKGAPYITFFGVLHVMELMIRRLSESALGGEPLHVDVKEAERRAGICAGCPHNDLHLCGTCKGLTKIVKLALGTRSTVRDKELGVCDKCGCSLAAKVHIDKKWLKAHFNYQDELPDFCWLKEKP